MRRAAIAAAVAAGLAACSSSPASAPVQKVIAVTTSSAVELGQPDEVALGPSHAPPGGRHAYVLDHDTGTLYEAETDSKARVVVDGLAGGALAGDGANLFVSDDEGIYRVDATRRRAPGDFTGRSLLRTLLTSVGEPTHTDVGWTGAPASAIEGPITSSLSVGAGLLTQVSRAGELLVVELDSGDVLTRQPGPFVTAAPLDARHVVVARADGSVQVVDVTTSSSQVPVRLRDQDGVELSVERLRAVNAADVPNATNAPVVLVVTDAHHLYAWRPGEPAQYLAVPIDNFGPADATALSGTLFVTDGKTIHRVPPSGDPVRLKSGADGVNEFDDLVVDERARLLGSDWANHRVVSYEQRSVESWVTDRVYGNGTPDDTAFDVPATKAGLPSLRSLATGCSGTFGTTGGWVVRLPAEPTSHLTRIATGSGQHDRIAAAPDGTIYSADWDNDVVWRIDPRTSRVSRVAGRPGEGGNDGDGGQATEARITPEDVAVLGNGELLITSEGLIRRVRSDGTIVTDVGTTRTDLTFGVHGADPHRLRLQSGVYIAVDRPPCPSRAGAWPPSLGYLIVDRTQGVIYRIDARGAASVFIGGGSDLRSRKPAGRRLAVPWAAALSADAVYVADRMGITRWPRRSLT